MIARTVAILALAAAPPTSPTPGGRAEKLAETYVEAIEELNAAHARKPGLKTETQLAAALPKKAHKALASLLELDVDDGLPPALEACARAALDLDRVDDFDRARARLAELAPARAEDLGVAHSGERVLVIAEGGLAREYAEHLGQVAGDVLAAYDEVFGFREFSKVPGKKLRLRVHLEEEIERPPHFAPQYAYHSEIDFPVIDAERLRSPTAKGQFLFYGLCHELGHVVAMWGNRTTEEDHHAWAHYTGVVIVEHMAQLKKSERPEWLGECTDARWRSLEKLREELVDAQPGSKDRESVLARLVALHDLVGPEAIGAAINDLDEENRRLRVNHVRYYSFRELSKALEKSVKNKKQRKALSGLFD